MWPSTLTEIGGMSRSNPFVVLMQYGENYAYSHADAVISFGKYAKDYMVEHGLAPSAFHYIPNGVIEDEWERSEPLPDTHRQVLEDIRSNGKFIVGYFGGHALSNCLLPFLQAAEEARELDVQFVLVGDGVEKPSLMKYADEHSLANVTFLDPVPKASIPTLVEYFDCSYMGGKKSPLYRFGVCLNKMFDSMMAGKPLIFAIDAPPTPVSDSACGIITEPESPQAIVSAIRQLMTMSKEERYEMGMRGRNEILERYTYSRLARDFIDVMESC